MSLLCPSCTQKQDLINKHIKLIKLLKIKCQKSSKSTLKSETFSQKSLFETSGSNAKENSSNIGPDQFDSYKQPTVSLMNDQKTQCYRLGLIVISNKIKKALLKQHFDSIKAAAKISEPISQISNQFDFGSDNISSSLPRVIEQTLNYGKELQYDSSTPVLMLKQLHMKIFSFESIVIQFKQKIAKLEGDLQDSQKRFYKQTEKKRQSLEAVAQEIREKNDFIAELQHTIKQYEKMSGKSFKKLCVQNILIEDELQLKRACLRLQNINEKLNCDVRNGESKIFDLNSQIVLLKKENLSLKSQISQIKEHNFDILHQINKTKELSQIYANLCQRLNHKIQNIKQTEKKRANVLNLKSKKSLNLSSNDIFASKTTEASSDSSPLSRKSSLRELQAQQKLQEIFSFIFNMNVEDYKMTNEQMFDEDELNLLKLHKNSYLNSIHNQNPQMKQRAEKIVKNDKLNETDGIFYLQSPQMSNENSFLNALEPKSYFQLNEDAAGNNIKLIDLEIEKSKLIEKISDLKKMHMHIRDVFLNFLKTIDFNILKPETFRILEIIFEVFEYSEVQKASLFKEKKKKFWGIL